MVSKRAGTEDVDGDGRTLDSKLNRQLANECRNPEQLQPVAITDKAPDAPATAVQ